MLTLGSEQLDATTIHLGELVGWRVWRLHVDRVGTLISPHMGHVHWQPQQIFYTDVGDYQGSSTGPGFYSFHRRFSALEHGNLMGGGCSYVVGSVYLWGLVYVHRRGYRSEYAYPKEFVFIKEPGLGWSGRVKRLTWLNEVWQ